MREEDDEEADPVTGKRGEEEEQGGGRWGERGLGGVCDVIAWGLGLVLDYVSMPDYRMCLKMSHCSGVLVFFFVRVGSIYYLSQRY